MQAMTPHAAHSRPLGANTAETRPPLDSGHMGINSPPLHVNFAHPSRPVVSSSDSLQEIEHTTLNNLNTDADMSMGSHMIASNPGSCVTSTVTQQMGNVLCVKDAIYLFNTMEIVSPSGIMQEQPKINAILNYATEFPPLHPARSHAFVQGTGKLLML